MTYLWITRPSSPPLCPANRIGKRELGYRCDLNAGFPRNHPHFNPGPGGYQPRTVYKGGKTEPGADAPKFMFSQGPKLMSPEKSISATVFISNVSLGVDLHSMRCHESNLFHVASTFPAICVLVQEHAIHENLAVHSPGPMVYSPKQTVTKQSARAYSLAAKASSYFDLFLDPERQPSPGPVYNNGEKDRRGKAVWGNDPRAVFGK